MDVTRLVDLKKYPARNIVLKGLQNTAEKTTQMQTALMKLMGGISSVPVTMTGLLQALGLPDVNASYDAALAAFLDSPTLGTLIWGNRTYTGSFNHEIAPGACDKTLDLTGGVFMPSTDQAPCLHIRNTIEWIEQVTAKADSNTALQSSNPSSGTPTTTVTLGAAHTVEQGAILKLYAMDLAQDINTAAPVETPGLANLRVGELMMCGKTSTGTSLILNGRTRESYGGAGYEDSIRIALYSRRMLHIIGGRMQGNPVGLTTWRGWTHTEIVGFTEFVGDRLTISKHYGAGFAINDCWMPKLIGPDAKNLDNSQVSTGLNRYGYGFLAGSGTYGLQILSPTGTNCRHLIDTGSVGIKPENKATALNAPWQFGVSYDTTVIGGDSNGLQNAPWGCHHNVRGMRFIDCQVTNTLVGDDSGGLPIASRGNDVHFIRIKVKSNRNGGNISCIQKASYQDCEIECGWNGLNLNSNHGVFMKDNRITYTGVFNNPILLNFAGPFGPYPSTYDDPVIVTGTHHFKLIGGGADYKATILAVGENAHVLLDGDIFVDWTEWNGAAESDGGITVIAFDGSFSSFRMTENSHIYLNGGDSTGDIYRLLAAYDNDYKSITSMTRVGTTVTCTTAATVKLYTGVKVQLVGADAGFEDYMVDAVITSAVTVGAVTTFTFETATTQGSPVTGNVRYRRYVTPRMEVKMEYRHNTKQEAGAVDQFVASVANLSWTRVINDVITRDTADFNFTASADGFYAGRVVDKEARYNFGGTGGVKGYDLERAWGKSPKKLTIVNSTPRMIRYDNPPIAIPPRGSFKLRGSQNQDWIPDSPQVGEILLFAGFVDLNQAGDQILKKAHGQATSGLQWMITQFNLVCQSGGDAGDLADGNLFLYAGGSGTVGQQYLITPGTTWNAMIGNHAALAYPGEFFLTRHFTENQVYVNVSTVAASGPVLCDAYVYGYIV